MNIYLELALLLLLSVLVPLYTNDSLRDLKLVSFCAAPLIYLRRIVWVGSHIDSDR